MRQIGALKLLKLFVRPIQGCVKGRGQSAEVILPNGGRLRILVEEKERRKVGVGQAVLLLYPGKIVNTDKSAVRKEIKLVMKDCGQAKADVAIQR